MALEKFQRFYNYLQINKPLLFFGFIISGFIISYWFYITDKYSVNIFFWDQWDFYMPYFSNASFVEIYFHQHGPHRQGIGFLITGLLDQLSGWNTRIIAFFIIFCVIGVTFFYLWIKRRIFGKLVVFDLIIIFIALDPVQIYLITPNLSHGPIPAVLTAAFCFCMLIRNIYVRNLLLLVITFNVLFSGFGLFFASLVPLLFLYESTSCLLKKDYDKFLVSIICLVITIYFLYIFTIGYEFKPANPTFKFPHERPLDYLYFVGLAFSGFIGSSGTSIISILIGSIIVILLLGISIYHIQVLVKNLKVKKEFDHKIEISKIILLLITYSLIFIISTAIGRVSLGLEGSQSTRYMLYLAPSLIAIYFHINFITTPLKSLGILAMFVFFLVMEIFGSNSIDSTVYYGEKKEEWKKIYLKYENYNLANQLTGFQIYPNEKVTLLEEKMDFFKKENLSLYSDYHLSNIFSTRVDTIPLKNILQIKESSFVNTEIQPNEVHLTSLDEISEISTSWFKPLNSKEVLLEINIHAMNGGVLKIYHATGKSLQFLDKPIVKELIKGENIIYIKYPNIERIHRFKLQCIEQGTYIVKKLNLLAN